MGIQISASADKVVIAPLCGTCSALPTMLRWHRCMKMMRTMYKAKTGKNRHYVFAGLR